VCREPLRGTVTSGNDDGPMSDPIAYVTAYPDSPEEPAWAALSYLADSQR
jgi:hypothetical protein